MSRLSDQVGKHGQDIAERVLRMIGVKQVEQIATPVKLIRVHGMNGVYRVIWGKKVAADFRGVGPDGKSVLAEVKTYRDGNLPYGALEPHQHDFLREHAKLGAISLLVWVHESGVYVLPYPIDGFRKGKSITASQARALHIEAI
jgi:penicillin-binding protein-related factor A (putative recombinase)